MAVENDECLRLTYPDIYGELYEALYAGLRDVGDPVTWRTMLVDVASMLGVDRPEWEPVPQMYDAEAQSLLLSLVGDTSWRLLVPEMMVGLGLPEPSADIELLDFLVANGRRFGPDPLFWRLTEEAEGGGFQAALFNPVGNYNDGQPRVAGPRSLLRGVNNFVVLVSTQSMDGGSQDTLVDVARLIRNPDFGRHVSRLNIVIPMIGGSRGHRLGQSETMTYEVLEMIAGPKALALPLQDIVRSLRWDLLKSELASINPLGVLRYLAGLGLPDLRVVTVDIHNDELPARVYRKHGIEFVSASPAIEFANAVYTQIETQHLLDVPVKVIVCDEGAIGRSEGVALHLLHHPKNHLETVDLVYVDKTRIRAGEVSSAHVSRVFRWTKEADGSVAKTEMETPSTDNPSNEGCVVVFSDDMADTCGTATRDVALIKRYFSNIYRSMFIFTHPVLSRGIHVLDTVGVNIFLIGNTLRKPDELWNRDDVVMVDMAPAILRAIQA